MQPARERPLQRADPGQLRRPGRWIHESGRDDAELCNGDPDAGRPHADPGTAVRAVHRRRPRYDVVVRDERPLRDRDRRGPRRLRPIEPRWDDPARGTRARGRHPTRDEDELVRPQQLLLRYDAGIPVARESGGWLRLLVYRTNDAGGLYAEDHRDSALCIRRRTRTP